MAKTLLAIIQDATKEIGLETPTTVISNTDPDVVRLLSMCNRHGRDLVEESDWTVLQRLHTFTTVDSQDEYSLPADYSRLIMSTEWDRTNAEPLWGPTSTQEWEAIKSGLIGSGIVGRRYKIIRSASSTSRKFYLDPTPGTSDAGETLAFWYISSYFCATLGGTAQAAWAADTDVTILDDDLMILGTILRYKRSTGLEYASEADEYARMLSRKKGMDRPAPVLSMTPGTGQRLIGFWNLPNTGLTG